MAAQRKSCVVCGKTFYGGKRAKYCHTNCKQRVYDARHRKPKTEDKPKDGIFDNLGFTSKSKTNVTE